MASRELVLSATQVELLNSLRLNMANEHRLDTIRLDAARDFFFSNERSGRGRVFVEGTLHAANQDVINLRWLIDFKRGPNSWVCDVYEYQCPLGSLGRDMSKYRIIYEHIEIGAMLDNLQRAVMAEEFTSKLFDKDVKFDPEPESTREHYGSW